LSPELVFVGHKGETDYLAQQTRGDHGRQKSTFALEKAAKPVSREAFESPISRLSPVEIKTAMKQLQAMFQLIE
jgi:hypothetical protein